MCHRWPMLYRNLFEHSDISVLYSVCDDHNSPLRSTLSKSVRNGNFVQLSFQVWIEATFFPPIYSPCCDSTGSTFWLLTRMCWANTMLLDYLFSMSEHMNLLSFVCDGVLEFRKDLDGGNCITFTWDDCYHVEVIFDWNRKAHKTARSFQRCGKRNV